MSSTLEYEYPVWFRATPIKHRTPKVVCGKFVETFEVPEVDTADVNAAIDIMIAGEVGRYFEIEGRFCKFVGMVDSEAVKTRYDALNSPIPCVGREYSEMRTQAMQHAKAEGIGLFPKRGPEYGVADVILQREWFSDVDMQWIDRRRHEAVEFLSHLRCSEGNLYEPISEPAFVVNMRTERDVAGVWVQFRAASERHFYWGYPVAYFRADQQEEAIEYASALASRHEINADPFDRRAIDIHDAGSLRFDPYPAHVLEAATLACRAMPDQTVERLRLVEELRSLIGPDLDHWRTADAGAISEDTLMDVDRLLRAYMDLTSSLPFPEGEMIKTLMERWDDRPIDLRGTPSSLSASHGSNSRQAAQSFTAGHSTNGVVACGPNRDGVPNAA